MRVLESSDSRRVDETVQVRDHPFLTNFVRLKMTEEILKDLIFVLLLLCGL